MHTMKSAGIVIASILTLATVVTSAEERDKTVHFYQNQGEIHHLRGADMPYDKPSRPNARPSPPPRWDSDVYYYPSYYYLEDRPYYENDEQNDPRQDEGSYVTDEYNNCYRVEYEEGFRTLVDVRAKYCR